MIVEVHSTEQSDPSNFIKKKKGRHKSVYKRGKRENK